MAAVPSGIAVAGLAVPGLLEPGNPGTASTSGLSRYTGLVPVSYLQYLDLLTSHTLSPSPGQACAPLPVENMPPVPPDGNWISM